MKKILALFLTATLVMTLFYGCKGGGDETTSSEPPTDASGYYIDDSKTPLEVGDAVD